MEHQNKLESLLVGRLIGGFQWSAGGFLEVRLDGERPAEDVFLILNCEFHVDEERLDDQVAGNSAVCAFLVDRYFNHWEVSAIHVQGREVKISFGERSLNVEMGGDEELFVCSQDRCTTHAHFDGVWSFDIGPEQFEWEVESMGPMTNPELGAMAVRCEAASPGPWISMVEGRNHYAGSDFIKTGSGGPDIELHGGTRADQDFVAHARQDVPRLIKEVRRLQGLLEE